MRSARREAGLETVTYCKEGNALPNREEIMRNYESNETNKTNRANNKANNKTNNKANNKANNETENRTNNQTDNCCH